VRYGPGMTFLRQIPVDRLAELELAEGDTLRIVGKTGATFVVQVSRPDASPTGSGKARDWLRSAKGSVHLRDGDTVSDARLELLQRKYGSGR
jgi:hypothetical protein